VKRIVQVIHTPKKQSTACRYGTVQIVTVNTSALRRRHLPSCLFTKLLTHHPQSAALALQSPRAALCLQPPVELRNGTVKQSQHVSPQIEQARKPTSPPMPARSNNLLIIRQARFDSRLERTLFEAAASGS
jgi:hypothetical protein